MAVNDSIDRINIGGDERMIKPAASNVNVAQYTPSSGSAWNPGDVQEALEQLKEGKADLSYFGTVPPTQLPIEDLQSTLRNVVVGYFNGARNKFFDSLGTPAPYATDLLYVEMGTGIIYRWDGSTFETVGGAVSHENEQSGSSITDSTSLVAHDVVTVSDVKTAESRVEIKADGTITRSEMGSSDVTFNLPAESGTLALASEVSSLPTHDSYVAIVDHGVVNPNPPVYLKNGEVITALAFRTALGSILDGADNIDSTFIVYDIMGKAFRFSSPPRAGESGAPYYFENYENGYMCLLKMKWVNNAAVWEYSTSEVISVQSDWDEDDATSLSYIQNKPDLDSKQDTLVSGTNIKTLNSASLLGSGDLTLTTEGVVIVNDLTTGGANAALSAEQGKVLGQKVNDVDNVPTAGSEKFVKSGGVYKGLDDVLEKSLEFVKKEVSDPIEATVISGIPGSDGFFVDGTGFESLLYDISDVNYADIVLKTGNNNAFLTFLKSMPVVDSLMDTSDNVARHTAVANSVVEFKIPYGTKYIVIDNRTAFQVQSVSFLGVEGNINGYLQKSEIETGVISDNIANPDFVIDGKYVSGTGVIGDEAGWSVIKLPVEVGKRYTFAGFVINRTNNNYAFYNDDTLVLKNEYNPNQNPVYVTEATPAGANYLYMTIKSDSTGSNYDNLQVNEGTELKPYDEYKEGIVEIAGYAIEGTGGSGTTDIQSLIADLPVSDGTDISVGYAYIDSTTNIVKVKVS